MMSEHPEIDEERTFLLDRQAVRLEDVFRDEDLILDLGGGGEGIIGQLRGRQVVALDRRKDELAESAPGPIKIVADAQELPFLDGAFDAATAFFFLMYVPNTERMAVLKEAHRVLRPSAMLHIWDVTIPPRGESPQEAFVVPVKVELPDKTIETGYGIRWDGHEMSADSVADLAKSAGFTLCGSEEDGETFHLALSKGID